MTGEQLGRAVRQLRRLIDPQAGELPDAQLLRRFVAQRDEGAFEALVARHGPMVLGVCRRLLRDGPDAEDAFQATFLLLARKAASLRRGELVGNWLYGVAYRVAVRARAYAARRRARQQPVLDVPAPEAPDGTSEQELRAALDEELHRLPEKYRAPLVLCCLEGRTTDEAAEELGWPRGTVATRLAWARERLRARLARRGLAPAGALLPAVTQAALPPALVDSVVKVAPLVLAGHSLAGGTVSVLASALMKGALHEMYLRKIAVLAAVVLAATLMGAGVLAYRARPTPPTNGEPSAPQSPAVAQNGEPEVEPMPPPRPAPEAPRPAEVVPRIQPGDWLKVEAPNTLPEQPISGNYRVEPNGTLPLGLSYGRANVRGLTIEEAEAAVRKQLALVLKTPTVSVTWADVAGGPFDQFPLRICPGTALQIKVLYGLANAPLGGTYIVEPSGKVPLGPPYGRVALAGLTLEEAEKALHNHLAPILKEPKVFITLAGAVRPNDSQREQGVEKRLEELVKEVRALRAAVEAIRAARGKPEQEAK